MAGDRWAPPPARFRLPLPGRGRHPLRRRVALAVALVPLAVVGVGTARLGEQPTLLTSLSQTSVTGTATAPPSDPWAATRPRGKPTVQPPAAGKPAVRNPAVQNPAVKNTAGSTPAVKKPAVKRPATPAVAATSVPRGLTAGPQEVTGLRYATVSPAETLDLYLPERTGKAVPLVIEIHGGAFEGGARSEAQDRIEALRDHGYAVASIDYRLSDEAPFPAGVRDVKAAVRWLRANAARYGIDPGRFAAWGDSAGGYFTAVLGTTSGRTTTFDDASLGNAKVSSSVQAVVDFYGPVDFLTMDRQAASPGGCPGSPQVHDAGDSPESRWLGAPVQSAATAARNASPITYLPAAGARSSGIPPFYLAHGTADCQVPQGQSLQLAAALKAAKVPHTLTLLDGIGHGAPEFEERLRTPVIAFLDRTFGRS